MSRAILVTGATGRQGRAVIDALVAQNASSNADHIILAATRNPQSANAQALLAKSPAIRLVEGDMERTPALFAAAQSVAQDAPITGVFSVQVALGQDATSDGELRQGKAILDEAIKTNVRHFVYSSVDRGGNDKSWHTPTDLPHFRTKYEIERHLRGSTADGRSPMQWTILRPVTFMDILEPSSRGKVLATALRDTIQDRLVQWVAARDIGIAAALAFRDPGAWNGKAVGLASDELNFAGVDQAFEKVTGKPVPTTFSSLGTALKDRMPEFGQTLDWFREVGYGVDIAENRKFNPNLQTMED